MLSRSVSQFLSALVLVGILVSPTSLLAGADELTLYTAFAAERDLAGGWQERAIREGDTLRSGEGVKILFETNRPAHVYVVLVDSGGKANQLFPPEGQPARVSGREAVELPPGDGWLFLDDRTGRETIYVIARLEPLGDLRPLLDRLEAQTADRDDALVDQAVVEWVRDPVQRPRPPAASGPRTDLPDGGPAADKPVERNKPMLIAGVVRGIKVVQKTSSFRFKRSGGATAQMQAAGISDRGAVIRAVSFLHR
jgi:hypothetical protein